MTKESLYIVVVEDAASILCEKHARAYTEIMASMNKEATVVDLETEGDDHICMACDMQDELTRPQIILPH